MSTAPTKVLVVEDDPGIRTAICLKLRMAGFESFEASDGIEALEHLESSAVDLVVADVGMPRMDGYTLCRRLHEQESTRGVPVVILTAQDMCVPDDVKANIGRHRFMTKPFSPRALMVVVREILAEKEV